MAILEKPRDLDAQSPLEAGGATYPICAAGLRHDGYRPVT